MNEEWRTLGRGVVRALIVAAAVFVTMIGLSAYGQYRIHAAESAPVPPTPHHTQVEKATMIASDNGWTCWDNSLDQDPAIAARVKGVAVSDTANGEVYFVPLDIALQLSSERKVFVISSCG